MYVVAYKHMHINYWLSGVYWLVLGGGTGHSIANSRLTYSATHISQHVDSMYLRYIVSICIWVSGGRNALK